MTAKVGREMGTHGNVLPRRVLAAFERSLGKNAEGRREHMRMMAIMIYR